MFPGAKMRKLSEMETCPVEPLHHGWRAGCPVGLIPDIAVPVSVQKRKPVCTGKRSHEPEIILLVAANPPRVTLRTQR